MVRLQTRRPSFSNSPRILSAPQSRLSFAICLIEAMVSAATFGLWEEVFALRFQYRRKSSRCHRSSVSGCTITRACCQVRTSLASRTRRKRSVLLIDGRYTCRLSMRSWCRKRAFSAMSSDLLLLRLVKVENGKEVKSGFVQPAKREESACKQPSFSRWRGVKTPAINNLLHHMRVSLFEHEDAFDDV